MRTIEEILRPKRLKKMKKQQELFHQGKLYLLIENWGSDEGVITHLQPEKIIVYKWFRNKKVEYKIRTICTRFSINWEDQTFTLLNHNQKDGNTFKFESNNSSKFGATGFIDVHMEKDLIQKLKQLEKSWSMK
jgi:hypothetical protein